MRTLTDRLFHSLINYLIYLVDKQKSKKVTT